MPLVKDKHDFIICGDIADKLEELEATEQMANAIRTLCCWSEEAQGVLINNFGDILKEEEV